MTHITLDEFNDFVEATNGNTNATNAFILQEAGGSLTNKKINYIKRNWGKLVSKFCNIDIQANEIGTNDVTETEFRLYYNIAIKNQNGIDNSTVSSITGLSEEQVEFCKKNFIPLRAKYIDGFKFESKTHKAEEKWESSMKFLKIGKDNLEALQFIKTLFKEEFMNIPLFNEPIICIPSEITTACEKIQRKLGAYEFSIVTNGKWEGNKFSLEKTYEIPHQKVTSCGIDFDNIDEHKCNVIIHSHPKGVTSFSHTDDKTVNSNFECSILFEDDTFKDCTVNFYFGDMVIQIAPKVEFYRAVESIPGFDNIKKNDNVIISNYNYNSYKPPINDVSQQMLTSRENLWDMYD